MQQFVQKIYRCAAHLHVIGKFVEAYGPSATQVDMPTTSAIGTRCCPRRPSVSVIFSAGAISPGSSDDIHLDRPFALALTEHSRVSDETDFLFHDEPK
jgi:hypothetical protein